MLRERAREQAVLADALSAARGPIVIEGEAGIGKTALLDWLAERARADGMIVRRACGAELERAFAFGVARQLLGATPVSRDEAAAMHALYWQVAGSGRGALLVDDAQWADPPSLRFLVYLARRLDGLGVTLVVARRTGEPALLVDQLAAEPTATVLFPSALSPTAVGALVSVRLGGPHRALAAACHRATGGNPLLVGALLDDLETVPRGERLERVGGAGPGWLQRTLLVRLGALGPDATALVSAVAVAGDGVRPIDAARLAGLASEDAAALALDALVAARFLEAGEGVAFVHPLVRQAIYASIPPAARAGLHRRSALALEAAGADPGRVAAQWLAVPPGDDLAVQAPLRAAAEQAAARGAHDVAARYLRRALAETADHPAALRVALGRHAALAGEPDAAEHLRVALAASTDPELRTDAAIALSEVDIASGADSSSTLERLADELEATHPALALRLDAQLGLSRTMRGHMPRRLACRLDAPDTWADSPALLAVMSVELAARARPSDEVAALAERALAGGGGDLLATRAPILAVVALVASDRLTHALALCDRVVDDAQAALAFAIGSMFRAHVRFRLGDVHEAEADARASLAAVEDWSGRDEALATLVAPLRERGALDEAESLLGDLAGSSFMAAQLRFEAGLVRLARGDAGRALADFRHAGETVEAIGVRSPALLAWRSGAALALGEGAEATTLAEVELELARTARVPSAEAAACRVLGLVGSPSRRVERLQEAVTLAARSPARLEHARALVDLGAAHHRAGQRTAARAALAEGLDRADRCGATALSTRARELLVRSGARPRRARLSGVHALTASERRTVEMAAGGLSNRDIARSLFVTPKTVEAHLTHAYAKLGVHRREQLAAALGVE